MSNNIIQITEENLRKAVESGDLKQLAPEVFEKKKVKLEIRLNGWGESLGYVFPLTVDIWKDSNGLLGNNFSGLIGKGPMLMTLEWEE